MFPAIAASKPPRLPPLSPLRRNRDARVEWWPVDSAWRDSRNNSQPGHCDATGVMAIDLHPPQRLALFGLPPALAEPVTMLAEILGWQVIGFPPGAAVCPPARLCLAMLPAGDDEQPPIVAWSPQINLNEHISRAGLSIMDQPICISRVEQMLEALVCEP